MAAGGAGDAAAAGGGGAAGCRAAADAQPHVEDVDEEMGDAPDCFEYLGLTGMMSRLWEQ